MSSPNIEARLLEKVYEQLEGVIDREELPAYVLAKLVDRLSMRATESPEDEQEAPSVLEIVNEGRLPLEKRRELLMSELKELDNYREQVVSALEEIDAGEKS